LVDLDEILYGGGAIGGDLNVITFNPIPSTILKWLRNQNCEVDALPAPFSLAQQWVWIA
jgi:hypothetical protein